MEVTDWLWSRSSRAAAAGCSMSPQTDFLTDFLVLCCDLRLFLLSEHGCPAVKVTARSSGCDHVAHHPDDHCYGVALAVKTLF